MLYLITHKYVKMATAKHANNSKLPTPLQDTYGYIKKICRQQPYVTVLLDE